MIHNEAYGIFYSSNFLTIAYGPYQYACRGFSGFIRTLKPRRLQFIRSLSVYVTSPESITAVCKAIQSWESIRHLGFWLDIGSPLRTADSVLKEFDREEAILRPAVRRLLVICKMVVTLGVQSSRVDVSLAPEGQVQNLEELLMLEEYMNLTIEQMST